MKIVFNLVLIIFAAALGLAVGYLVRGKPRAAKAPLATVSLAATQTASPTVKSMRQLSASTNASPPLVTQLERDLSMSSGVTRWLYWLDALEKATPQDFPRLVRLAQGNATALRFVAARWVELDPRHMFDTIFAAGDKDGFPVNELAQTLFEEWVKRDPKAVIEALDSDGMFKTRSWRMNVAGNVFKDDVELGLQLMSKWHIDHYIPSMSGVSKWAAADPRHAAEFTYQNQMTSLSREMMKTIGKEWAAGDPAAALNFANSKSGELGSVLAHSVLKEWASRDLAAASDWLANTDPRNRSRLASAFVESWAKQDAPSALEWCALNLTASSLAGAVGGVLTGLAQKDLAAAQALVANMSPSATRAAAADAVAARVFPNSFSEEKPVSPETFAWLKQLDPESLKRVLGNIYWRWISADTKGFAEFLKTANTEPLPSHIYSQVARNLARRNPTEAIDWAAQLPAERAVSVGGEAFAEWRRTQPEAAMEWFKKLPPDDSRREPFFESAMHTLAHDPQAAQQLAAMSASERAAARRVIETMPLSDDRRTKLLGMLSGR